MQLTIKIIRDFYSNKWSLFSKILLIGVFAFTVSSIFYDSVANSEEFSQTVNAIITPVICVAIFLLNFNLIAFYVFNRSQYLYEGRKRRAIIMLIPSIILSIVLAYSNLRDVKISDGAISLISMMVSLIIAVTWWFVRNEQMKMAAKKNHTLNVLLQSRLSPIYQEKLSDASSFYTQKRVIPDIESLTDDEKKKFLAMFSFAGLILSHYDKENESGEELKIIKIPEDSIGSITLDQDIFLKAKSIEGIKYLLNYFEFIAAGISKKDLYEPLLKECLKGIALNLHDRAKSLIKHSQSRDKEVWSNFVKMCEDWR